jgi:hypothetical protein
MSDVQRTVGAFGESTEPGAAPENICSLPLVRATFRRIRHGAANGFRIAFGPPDQERGQIDIDATDAEQFATELEALAALIRARMLR